MTIFVVTCQISVTFTSVSEFKNLGYHFCLRGASERVNLLRGAAQLRGFAECVEAGKLRQLVSGSRS